MGSIVSEDPGLFLEFDAPPDPKPQLQGAKGLTVPYKEYVEDFSPNSMNFGWDGDTQVTWTVDVAWGDLIQAIIDVVGFSYRDGDTLVRLPPIRHGKFAWLFGSRVLQVRGLAPVKRPNGWESVKGQGVSARSALYEKARITFLFQSFPYDFYFQTPADVGDESRRYVTVLPQANIDVAALIPKSFKYAEGALPGADPPGPLNTELSGLLALQKVIPKNRLTIIWHRLPTEYLFDKNLIPGNILGYPNPNPLLNQTATGIVGCINKTEFYGRAPGTLLAFPPDITPHLAPAILNFNDNLDTLRFWDVAFNFMHFDPELGPGAVTRGWNTTIWAHNMKFYKFTTAPKVGVGEVVYPTYEFKNAFRASGAQLLPNK